MEKVGVVGLDEWARERSRRVFARLMVVGDGRDGEERRILSVSK